VTRDGLVLLVSLEVWSFALGLAGIVFYQLVTGRINLRGLLLDKSIMIRDPQAGPGRISPTRVQLLTLTIAGVSVYIASLPAAAAGTLPDIPIEMVAVFGASASVYLGGKGAVLLMAGRSRGVRSDNLKDRESNE
jgi:hypothetical protein